MISERERNIIKSEVDNLINKANAFDRIQEYMENTDYCKQEYDNIKNQVIDDLVNSGIISINFHKDPNKDDIHLKSLIYIKFIEKLIEENNQLKGGKEK